MVMPARHRGRRRQPPQMIQGSGVRVSQVMHVRERDDGLVYARWVIAANPCRYLGHRAAWLNSGGMACGVCGVPL